MVVSQNKTYCNSVFEGVMCIFPIYIYMKDYKPVGCWFDYSENENDG